MAVVEKLGFYCEHEISKRWKTTSNETIGDNIM